MKKTFLLLGIVAMALGNMTSCSNILEEEGTIPASAKTGDLTIALEQSPVNIITKADEDKSVSIDSYLDDVLVTLTAETANTTQPTGTTLPNETKYSELNSDKTYKVSTKSTYTLEASYDGMSDNENFAWNAPDFNGKKDNISVAPNIVTTATVDCILTNSIIEVDLTGLGSESGDNTATGGVYFIPQALYLTTSENSELDLIKDGSKETDYSSDKTLFVKAGVNANIVMTGFLSSDTNKQNLITTGKQEIKATGDNAIVANTKYVVKYALNGEEGKLKLEIKLNDLINVVEIPVTVNPYEDNTTN